MVLGRFPTFDRLKGGVRAHQSNFMNHKRCRQISIATTTTTTTNAPQYHECVYMTNAMGSTILYQSILHSAPSYQTGKAGVISYTKELIRRAQQQKIHFAIHECTNECATFRAVVPLPSQQQQQQPMYTNLHTPTQSSGSVRAHCWCVLSVQPNRVTRGTKCT